MGNVRSKAAWLVAFAGAVTRRGMKAGDAQWSLKEMSHLRSFQWCRNLSSASSRGVQKANPRAGLEGRELRLAIMPRA